MKVFRFKKYQDFVNVFDGRIYCISKDNSEYNPEYLCDLEEQDLLRLIDEKKIDSHGGCEFYLVSEEFKQEVLQEAILIKINEEENNKQNELE